jgi:hypothetical protein
VKASDNLLATKVNASFTILLYLATFSPAREQLDQTDRNGNILWKTERAKT